MRTNAPEEYQVDEGAPALLGSFVVVGPAAVSSKSSCSSVSRDEEYELATNSTKKHFHDDTCLSQ